MRKHHIHRHHLHHGDHALSFRYHDEKHNKNPLPHERDAEYCQRQGQREHAPGVPLHPMNKRDTWLRGGK
jgi:hypothetical protein